MSEWRLSAVSLQRSAISGQVSTFCAEKSRQYSIPFLTLYSRSVRPPGADFLRRLKGRSDRIISTFCSLLGKHALLSYRFQFAFFNFILDICFQFSKRHILRFSTYFVSDFTHHFHCIKSFSFLIVS